MFINSISSNLGGYFLGGKWQPSIRVVTDFGKFRGNSIAIRKEIQNGIVREKQFILWNEKSQNIINKIRNSEGKFDRLG